MPGLKQEEEENVNALCGIPPSREAFCRALRDPMCIDNKNAVIIMIMTTIMIIIYATREITRFYML